LSPAPSAIRFSDIKAILQGASGCSGCHDNASPYGSVPIFYTSYDRNGLGGAPDATDDLWFCTELRGRINFTDVASSPLLRKPLGLHHGGGAILTAASAEHKMFVNWILNGAPCVTQGD